MAKQKFFVVWKGRSTGIFTSWADCSKQVDGYPGAEYKSFATAEEAVKALQTNGAPGQPPDVDLIHQHTLDFPINAPPPEHAKLADKWQANERKILWSARASTGTHNYFFEVKEAANGSKYVVIDQTRKVSDAYESTKLRIFEDELLEFQRVLQKMIRLALSDEYPSS